ncbi:hypothetical protein PRJBM_00275 [Bartonella henselae]|nr:hypothetical protein Q654_00454 [Bartonella henselae JK 50]ETS10679.1 hypothetical protein Q655_00402 [Bartonella henselae JK 51]CDO39669.1 hypothetical protein PRJBM_00275 [Bartonella henselae]CUH90243.1 hypothetical protein BM1374164_00275 [Bartonella henselae]
MIFNHEYITSTESNSPNNKICHTITMSGLLYLLLGVIIGSKIILHLRDTMFAMSCHALADNRTIL